ncbi:MAG: aminotransferase class I/II-fold pyridoxal phosphate-dependent enzyme [Pseudomonadota bacterium]
MDILADANRLEAAGHDIVHLEIGQPSTPAPAVARAALSATLQGDALGYTVALGLPELRASIARLYGEWYNVDLDPARVIVTSGSSGAFVLAFTALFDADARVGVSEPGYPSYRQILRALNCVPVGLPTKAPSHQMVPDDLPMDLDGVMVASPANPTGTILDKPHLSALIGRAKEIGADFISDEIYHGLHYGKRAVSALEIDPDVWVINSFSKYFSMTGWRVGWMVVPEAAVRTVERLAQNLFICAPRASQIVAQAAMEPEARDELECHRAVYAASRQLLIDQLPGLGLPDFTAPDGAFYIYADVRHLTDHSRALAEDILAKAQVAVTPGLDFDPIRGHRTLRLSYAQSTERVAEGLRRLRRYFDDH